MARADGISGVAVMFTLGGTVLLYAGLKGKGIGTTVRTLLGGTNPESTAQETAITGGSSGIGSSAITGGVTGATGGIGGTPAKNKAIGRMLATPYGWAAGAQWNALDKLWTRESGWSNIAENPSGAYGIPQALPPTKLPAAGRKPVSSATAQIAWGLNYIRERYGNPVNAWAHELSAGWY
jgi:resuscitation-promoting factor RpfB